MSIEKIATLLGRCNGPEKNFPPTDLYNEGWMLRLVLDWFSSNPGIDHDLAFSPTDKWYSEALLPSAFLARVRGDELAESWTHANSGDTILNCCRVILINRYCVPRFFVLFAMLVYPDLI